MEKVESIIAERIDIDREYDIAKGEQGILQSIRTETGIENNDASTTHDVHAP